MKEKTGAKIKYTPVPYGSTTTTAYWRPWPLRLPFLFTFTIICVVLITGLELTLRSCKPDGCPVFGEPQSDPSNISSATNFVYNYLPTVVSVLFGLLIAVLHHDSMRMEPWFQLSREEGAPAEGSLLSEYSYMFPVFVLFEAIKLRHFSVMTTSIMLLFTSIILIPMTAGLFDDSQLPRVIEHNMTFPSLQWMNKTANYSTGEFSSRYTYLAYSYAWLNGSLPSFTTAEYALAPWTETNSSKSLTNSNNSTKLDHLWTGPSILYEADIECEESTRKPIIADGIGIIGYNLTRPVGGTHVYLWDNGAVDSNDTALMKRLEDEIDGFTSAVFTSQKKLFADGASYYSLSTKPTWNYLIADNPFDDKNYLEYLDSMVYIWASAPTPNWNTTRGASALPMEWEAVYCSPRFYQQQVNATVHMPAGVIQNISRIADRTLISTNKTYLSDFFDDLHLPTKGAIDTSTAYLDYFGRTVGLGGLPIVQPENLSQLLRRFGGSAGTPNVQAKYDGSSLDAFSAFALYTQRNDTLHTLFKPDNIIDMYRRALKLQFSMVCRDRWLNTKAETLPATITGEANIRGFRANEDWFRGAQGGLALLTVLLVVLIVLLWGRRCALDGEPNSLANALGILQRSPEIAMRLENSEFNPMDVISRVVGQSDVRYRLVLESGVGPRVEVLTGDRSLPVRMGEPDLGLEEEYREKREWPDSTGSGIFFTTLFLAMLVVAVVLYICAKVMKGIPTSLQPNSFGYKILFSYLPTLVGVVVEPLLVTLGAHYSMLGPYRSLRLGNASSEKSLAVDFDKSPPHFQAIRSLRARDFLLCGLSIAILLSNVLAVALAGLFSPVTLLSTVSLPVESFGEPQFTRGFDGIPAVEMHYILSSNLSGDVSLPDWTTNDYYILPFSLPSKNGLNTASAATLGVGASISCDIVPSSQIDAYCYMNFIKTKIPCPRYWTKPGPTYMATLSAKDTCWPQLGNISRYDTIEEGQAMTWSIPASDYFAHTAQCPGTFFAAWAEQPADREHGAKNISMSYLPEIDSAVLRCTSTEEVVHVSATVDAKGNVLSVEDITPISPQEVKEFYPNGPGELIRTFINTTAEATYGSFYLTPLVWFNYHLVTLYPDVVQDIRPNITRIPNIEVLPAAFEDIYRRLYAINLRLYASDVIKSAAPPQEITATATVLEDRVAVSTPMLWICAGIVLYAALLIILLYWGPRAGNEIAHSPTCLVLMWSALYASNAKEICGGIRGPTSDARMKELGKLKARYTYGRFVTQDGRKHVGVYLGSKEK